MLADEHTKTLFFILACDDDPSTTARSDQLVAINSTDSGLTWSTPAVNITAGTRLSTYKGGSPSIEEAYIPAIGGGIQTQSGRLVAQMYGIWCFTDPAGACNRSGAFRPNGESPLTWSEVNHVLYSDDHGATSAPLPPAYSIVISEAAV